MEVLILCNTYYQFIVASQLKVTRFKEDNVYLVFSDHTKNMMYVSERVKSTKIFKDVYFIETLKKDREGLNRKSLHKEFFPLIIGKNKKYNDN